MTRRGFLGLIGTVVGAVATGGVAKILAAPAPIAAAPITATVVGEEGLWTAPMIFPLIRRVYPAYVMNEMVCIQPLDRQGGTIFYLDACSK